MRTTSTSCDRREHGMCDGSCVYMDQDGPSSYTCECSCHRAAREAARLPHALARVRQVLIEERLDRIYEVVPKASASGSHPEGGAT